MREIFKHTINTPIEIEYNHHWFTALVTNSNKQGLKFNNFHIYDNPLIDIIGQLQWWFNLKLIGTLNCSMLKRENFFI